MVGGKILFTEQKVVDFMTRMKGFLLHLLKCSLVKKVKINRYRMREQLNHPLDQLEDLLLLVDTTHQ